ncbi:hypothetical protein QUF88_22050 [Bacillus sp. DX1.1]|uniref:hypothetical protein n=1 Tax=unclassified Bacillus (in: firmicutes) TaxID=185979 RepID=UPI002570034A|nr:MULTISPECIES: hypothetical protein [unclassified Bacillus (in: firmicutes)]MDM5156396.1 hypothetical protein [Bacillus sp. DX1.1]WJE80667.1 hypothetical protein QRE67_19585 [Bacillus sp. DX3.1]
MKAIKFLITIAGEIVGIYLFSKMVSWSFMETFFLGSLAIFAVIWLIIMNISRNTNMDHAINKGLTGVKTGEIQPFQVTLNPYITGALSLVIISLITTVIYYLPYFI